MKFNPIGVFLFFCLSSCAVSLPNGAGNGNNLDVSAPVLWDGHIHMTPPNGLYFAVYDADTGLTLYTRNTLFHIDEGGMVIEDLHGGILLPGITAPTADVYDFEVLCDGSVQYRISITADSTVFGSVGVYALSSPVEDPTLSSYYDGVPSLVTPECSSNKDSVLYYGEMLLP